VIDVSQAVELDHPMALDFLRRDCQIMMEFFAKKNIQTLSLVDTYEFVTDLEIEDAEAHLADMFLNKGAVEQTADEEHKDNIFAQ